MQINGFFSQAINRNNKMFKTNLNTNSPAKNISFGAANDFGYEDLMKRINDEKNYNNEIYEKCFTPLRDKSGKPILDKKGQKIMILLPEIKDQLDSSVFTFKDFQDKEFQGTIKDAFQTFAQNFDNQPEVMERLLHGTSQESIKDIIENGVKIPRSTNTYFGPGMYFAISEGDAQDYSSAKLMADVIRVPRENGEKGKFVRFYGDYYDRIKAATIKKTTELIEQATGLSPKSLPDEPYYKSNARCCLPFLIFGEYCRQALVNDLGIDAAYASAPYHHSCVVVFNADAVKNVQKYQ